MIHQSFNIKPISQIISFMYRLKYYDMLQYKPTPRPTSVFLYITYDDIMIIKKNDNTFNLFGDVQRGGGVILSQ